MKIRKLFKSILAGLCVCLSSAALFTACDGFMHEHSYVKQVIEATHGKREHYVHLFV